MRISDRLLFLKYALPCAGTLIKRGVVSQEYVNDLVALVSDGKAPKDSAESLFKVANVMCESIARRMGKNVIDAEVIRQYFLFEHSEVVDDRFESMGDFNPADCKTQIGKVIEVNNGFALVDTVSGRKRYKTVFAKDVKKDDRVVVHFDFIVEKVSDKMTGMMSKESVANEKGN